jgi:hypothetical protein
MKRLCEKPSCGESLRGRNKGAHVCSGTCRSAKHRGYDCLTYECKFCGEDFTPRRSDSLYCDECRRTERYRRPRPPCCKCPCPTETPGGGPWFCDNCGGWLPRPDWVPG